MIINIASTDVKEGLVPYYINKDKEVRAQLRVSASISDISSLLTNPSVALINIIHGSDGFEQDLEVLSQLYPRKTSKLLVYSLDLAEKNLANLNIDYFSSLCELAPESVKLVFKLPQGYSDMKTVFNISQKYPNSGFCGGNLLKLPGCNIGCLPDTDTKHVVLTPCSFIEYSPEFVIFKSASIRTSTKPASSKPKREASSEKVGTATKLQKPTSSLFSFDVDGLDNF